MEDLFTIINSYNMDKSPIQVWLKSELVVHSTFKRKKYRDYFTRNIIFKRNGSRHIVKQASEKSVGLLKALGLFDEVRGPWLKLRQCKFNYIIRLLKNG